MAAQIWDFHKDANFVDLRGSELSFDTSTVPLSHHKQNHWIVITAHISRNIWILNLKRMAMRLWLNNSPGQI